MGRLTRFFSLGCLGVACWACAEAPVPDTDAPPLRLRTSVDPVEATIYDPITVSIHLDFAEGVAPDIPDAPSLPAGLVRDESRVDGPTPIGTRTSLSQIYTVHGTENGAYVFPEIVVPYELPDGTQAEAKSARLFLNIQSVLESGANELADLRDIHGPVPMPRTPWPHWPLVAAVACGILIGAALLGWWVRRRTPPEATIPLLPPDKEALLALAQLERSGLLERGETREYLFGLNEIFCAYLERRFAVPAVSSTSEQLLPALAERSTLPKETTILVKRFISETDPVKYAKAPAEASLATRWQSEIRRYVEMTAPAAELEKAA